MATFKFLEPIEVAEATGTAKLSTISRALSNPSSFDIRIRKRPSSFSSCFLILPIFSRSFLKLFVLVSLFLHYKYEILRLKKSGKIDNLGFTSLITYCGLFACINNIVL